MANGYNRLFIIVERSDEPATDNVTRVGARVDAYAPSDWRQSKQIIVAGSTSGSVRREGSNIHVEDHQVRDRDFVLFTTKAREQCRAFERPAPAIRCFSRTVSLRSILTSDLRGNSLFEILDALHFGKLHALGDRIVGYMYGSKRGAEAAAQWIEQWTCFGRGDLGTALLEAIDYRPTAGVCRALGALESTSDTSTECTLTGLGSSGGILARGLREFRASKFEKSFVDVMSDEDLPDRVVVFDDGLWSGYDAIKQIRTAIFGANSDENQSIPSRFKNLNVELHFSVKTDLGVAALESYLRVRRLDQLIRVSESSGQTLKVLTDCGKEAFNTDRMSHDEVISFRIPEAYVKPLMEVALGSKFDGAKELLTKICRGLAPMAWGEDKIRQNLFGTNNIGGLTVFGHGVPQALLPVFRVEKTIRLEGWQKQVHWRPLFPEAKRRK